MQQTKSKINLHECNDKITQNAHSRSIGKIGWFKVTVQDSRGAYKGARQGRQIGALFGPNGAIAGTIVGGAILGGAKSYSAYKKMVANAEVAPYSYAPITAPVEPMTPIKSFEDGYVISKDQVKPYDYTLGLNSGLDSCSVKIAIQHNKILANVELIEFNGDLPDLKSNLTELEQEIVNSEKFVAAYNEIMNDPLSTDVGEGYTSDQIMDLFAEAVGNSCSNQDELTQIVTRYTSIVKSSTEISDEEKEWLYSAFAVMSYSYEYWSGKSSQGDK